MGSGAWVPAHLTGFFEIWDSDPDPLRRGSRGAGVNLGLGIETEVTYNPSLSGISIEINREPRRDAIVSLSAAKELLTSSGKRGALRVKHRVPVPIGSGFGTSGAAALGIYIAGSKELLLDLSLVEAAKQAHRIEVKHMTGLGTVAGEFCGGLEVRKTPGAPGIGQVTRVPLSGQRMVVAIHNGPLSTARILGDPVLRARVNESGRRMTDLLLKQMTAENFMKLSHQFALKLHLAPEAAMNGLRKAASEGLYVGMAMFGRTYFTVVEERHVEWALGIMRTLLPTGRAIIAPVSSEGAKPN